MHTHLLQFATAVLSLGLSACATPTTTQKSEKKPVAKALKPAPKPAAKPKKAPAPPPAAKKPEPAPAAAKAPAAKKEAPPPTPEPTMAQSFPRNKKGPFKVLMLGDSMTATDFGKALEKLLDAHPQVECARRGRSATGLARPDYFDWQSEGRKQAKKHDPDLIIVVMGGNDGQDLIDKAKKKRRVFWKGKKWPENYSQRMKHFIDGVMAPYRKVVWIELPVMDRPRLEKKLTIIRQVQRELVNSLDEANYLSTRKFFVDNNDKLFRATKVKGYKAKQKLRQEDGIHFTVPGSRYFANRVYPLVLKNLGL